MFTRDILTFLRELSSNNNRDWFQEHNTLYKACRENFIQNIELIIHAISEFDPSVKGLDPKKCIFRINRDVRFSKDKSPYKTNFGAFITPGGRNAGNAGYYLHFEPGGSFLAGGIYMPPSPVLKAIRQEIFENFAEFKDLVNSEDFIQHFKAIDAEKLKTKPRGFPDDFEGMEYLRFKHYTVLKPYKDIDFTEPNFFEEVKQTFQALYPLNRFLNYAIKNQ